MRAPRIKVMSLLGMLAISFLLTVQPTFNWPQVQDGGKPDTILLTDGTPIHLVLMDDLQGKKLAVNQTVHFKVRQDLVVGSKIIVRAGSDAIGHIVKVSKSGLVGMSGRLVLQFDHVDVSPGVRISLRGGAGVSGGNGGALAVVSALWYGPDANLAVGTVVNAYVKQDQRLPAP